MPTLREKLAGNKTPTYGYEWIWDQAYWQDPTLQYRYLKSYFDSIYQRSNTSGLTASNPITPVVDHSTGSQMLRISQSDVSGTKTREFLQGREITFPLSDYVLHAHVTDAGTIPATFDLEIRPSCRFPLVLFHVIDGHVNFYHIKADESAGATLFTYQYDPDTTSLTDINPAGDIHEHTETFPETVTRVRLSSWPVVLAESSQCALTPVNQFCGIYDISDVTDPITITYTTCPGVIFLPESVEIIAYNALANELENSKYLNLYESI